MQLVGITIAVNAMDAMVTFYNVVFQAGLQPISAYSTTLYKGQLAGLELLLCPNAIAGVEAKQNRKQLRFSVPDLSAMSILVQESGGAIRNQSELSLGVADPDGNTIEFVQASA